MAGILKQYVFRALFYRFIGENFANYIEGRRLDNVKYATLPGRHHPLKSKELTLLKPKAISFTQTICLLTRAAGASTNEKN